MGFAHFLYSAFRIETWWSFIQSAVIKIGGQRLEFQGGEVGESPHFWVNGLQGGEVVENDENLDLLMTDWEELGIRVNYTKISGQQSRFRLDLGNGDAVSMTAFKTWIAVNIKANSADNFAGSQGLMGSYPSGAMVARDGTTHIQDTDQFGKEWQVMANEPRLFHCMDGPQHPQECAMPKATTKKRRLGESMITKEDATRLCVRVAEEDRDACISDVLATNDKDVASAYYYSMLS